MSTVEPSEVVIVHASDVESMANEQVGVHLLADASATGGALSSLRVAMAAGADGASPHRHDRSSELFYVLSGTASLLADDQVVTARVGDLVVIPPGVAHAFAASPGEGAELLIVITPGVERFEYFRHLARIAAGVSPPESLLETQERYDTWFLDSTVWRTVRRRGGDDPRRGHG